MAVLAACRQSCLQAALKEEAAAEWVHAVQCCTCQFGAGDSDGSSRRCPSSRRRRVGDLNLSNAPPRRWSSHCTSRHKTPRRAHRLTWCEPR